MSVAVCMQLEKSRQELETVRSENAQLKQFISQVRLVQICELYVIRPHRRRSWMRPIATYKRGSVSVSVDRALRKTDKTGRGAD